MTLSNLEYAFWLAGFVGQCVLLLVLCCRRHTSQFPCFTSLIVFGVLRTIFLYALHRSSPLGYFYAYWLLAFVDACLQVAVFSEIAWKVFRPTGSFSPDVRRPLLFLVSLSVFIALLLAFLSNPSARMLDQRLVIRSELFSTMLMAELFAGLTLISTVFGFVWKSQTMVILRGLGLYSLCALLIQGGQNFMGLRDEARSFHLLANFQVVCYLTCLCYWTVALMRDAPVTRPLPENVRLELARLDAYMTSVLAHVRSAGAAS